MSGFLFVLAGLLVEVAAFIRVRRGHNATPLIVLGLALVAIGCALAVTS